MPKLTVYLDKHSGFWYWSASHQGRRVRYSLGTRDETEARHRAARINPLDYFAEEKAQPEQSNPTLAEIHRHYLEIALPARPARPKTILQFRQQLTDFERFLADEHIGRIQQLNKAVIERYRAHLRGRGKSEKTINNYCITIRAALEAAYEAEIIHERPVRRWRLPKCVKSPMWAPTGAEMRLILATVRDRDPEIWPAIYTLGSTGLRPSDVVSLKPAHLDAEARTLRRVLTKTGETLHIPVSAALLAAVASQRVRSPQWVFCDYRGKPWALRTLLRRFKAATAPLKMPDLNLKSLRHGLARLMRNELGIAVEDVASQLGHTKSDMTLNYAPPRVQASVAEQVAERLG